MIHVERPRKVPPFLASRWRQATKDAERFFSGRTVGSKRQVKFEHFDFPPVWTGARGELEDLFQHKCAFCESRIGAGDEVEITHFRPKRDALDLKGTSSAEHYYWLAYTWENLYPSCLICARNKGNRFPVLGSRAAVGMPWAKLVQQEKALLLDPCRDFPEEHLVFGDEGHVASATLDVSRSGSPDRGTITIDSFGLNREPLVAARRRVATQVKEQLRFLPTQAAGDRTRIEQELARIVDASLEYSMVRRQVAARWGDTLLEEGESLRLAQLSGSEAAKTVQVSKPTRKRAFERLEAHEAQQAAVSIKDETSYRTSRITKVRIENFRRIEELEFEIPTSGWKMLLGENGTGKSSILQAVAIALMGGEHLERLRRLREFEPHKLVRLGADSSRIVVHQAASIEPIEVQITHRGFHYPPGRAQQKAVLLGFGSARWLPRPKSLSPERHAWIRVRNLVNPFVPLCDANQWLQQLDPRTNKFKAAEAVIKAILRLPDSARLRVVDSEVRVQLARESPRNTLSLDQLSDGNQSAIAMVAGIMGPLFSKYDVMRDAEGVVLVDELDAHLHPRWKMRIVGDLRRAFPNVQFIASTHEPLCLRGLLEREILSLREVDGVLEYTDDLPSPQSLRVDQLLTSRFFGLLSTFDPDTELALQRYYDLLALDSHTPEQEAELEQLKRTVAKDTVVGDTPREQAMYQVIDKYIAKQLRSDAPSPAKLTPETEDRLAEVWREALTAQPDAQRTLTEILKA